MAPMRQEYDNERVSNERLNAPSPTRDKYENLALTRNDDGLLVLRFHTAGSPAVFTGQTDEDFPAALEEISLDHENKALVITGTGDSFMDGQDRRTEPG